VAHPGALFVLSGPSGVGKTTLRRRLLSLCPRLSFSVSCTTRPPRPGEVDGSDYHFISRREFERLISKGAFLEWAWVFGEGYGTLKEEVLKRLQRGRDVLLEIDVQGAEKVRRRARSLPAPVHFIFVLPPSLEALRERLRKRGTEDPQLARRRLEGALVELAHAPRFEYLVINRDLDRAVEAIVRFILRAGAPRPG